MHQAKSVISLICVVLIVQPAFAGSPAVDDTPRAPAHEVIKPAGGWFTKAYRQPIVPPVDVSNSGRLDALIRAGRLYLSLQDAIALALENNLDIEIERYGSQIADSDILRAKAGGLLRGVPTNVQQGPSSATGGAGQQQTGVSQNAAQIASSGSSSSFGTIITSTGSAVPNLDPVVQGILRFGHSTTPQTSSFVTGTNTLVNRQDLSQFQVSQGFLTGTNVALGVSNVNSTSTALRSELNPSTSSSLSLNITQHLLQGFGPAVNSRYIRIAQNNREVSDLVFKQQVIATVTSIANLYWDLVSFNEDVRVKRQNLTTSQKLYNDNRKQVEIGTLAPIEIVRAEAEVASRQQDLTISETRVLQQETIIKNALSRNGVASPMLSETHVVPTDRIRLPDQEAVEPIQDLVAQARQARPELAQQRIQLENSKISLKGSKSELLPSVDAFVNLQNNSLVGQPNSIPIPPGQEFIPRSAPNPFFVGGFGGSVTQLFSRNFPDYSAGFQVNIPIRNRAAQADVIRDQLSMRQQELSLQRTENQLRVEVQNALIGLQQARASYQAAQKARILEEQTLDAEQKKFALGASTIYNVILVQRDLAQAQSNEVAALSNYSKARVELERATGATLETYNISLDEAFRGKVSRPPSPLPVLEPQQQQPAQQP